MAPQSAPTLPELVAERRSRKKQPGRLSLARRAARDLLELTELLTADPAICIDGPPAATEEGLELSLRLPVVPPAADREALAEQLLKELSRSLRQASRRGPALVSGEAWCLRCRRPGCLHARPPDRQSVFVGYSPTGTPQWEPFSARCLALAPERSDRLFGPHQEVVALVSPGDALTGGLLPEFGKESDGFQLLAQLELGFFDLGPQRIAVTFQALRIHPAGGRVQLLLHSIGLTPRELEVEPEELAGLDPLPLRALLRHTAVRLEGLLFRDLGGSATPPPALARAAEELLTKLKGGLERMFRQRGRRTLHAGQRSQEPGRPVEQALRDALAVAETDLLLDTRRGTYVVLGPRGRAHVFSASAQLVTSLKLDRDAVRRRRERERWRPVRPEEAAAFRAALQGKLNHGDFEELT